MRDNYSELIKAIKSLTDGVKVVADNQRLTVEAVNTVASELQCPSILIDTFTPEMIELNVPGVEGDLVRSIEFMRRRILHGEKKSRQVMDAAVRSHIDKLMKQVYTVKESVDRVSDVSDKVSDITERSYFALKRTGNAFTDTIAQAQGKLEAGIADSVVDLKNKSEEAVREANGRIEKMKHFTSVIQAVGGLEEYLKGEQDKVLTMLDSVVFEAAKAEGRAEHMNTDLLSKVKAVVVSIEKGIKPLDEKIDAIKGQVESKMSRLGHNITLDESQVQTQPVTAGRNSRRK